LKQKLLITGGCGKIGATFARFAQQRYDLRLVDRRPWDADRMGPLRGESLVLDLREQAACREACQGMDVVLHLAADADPEADFVTSLLPNNIMATHFLFEAAHEAGCKRFIYASSAHVVSGYPADVQVRVEMPVRPGNLYGVSKCFGEALAGYYASRMNLPCIVLRIGAYLFPDEAAGMDPDERNALLDPDDFNDLLVRCIETPGITHAIIHAISNNRFKRLDLSGTRELLGYQPAVDAFDRSTPGNGE